MQMNLYQNGDLANDQNVLLKLQALLVYRAEILNVTLTDHKHIIKGEHILVICFSILDTG